MRVARIAVLLPLFVVSIHTVHVPGRALSGRASGIPTMMGGKKKGGGKGGKGKKGGPKQSGFEWASNFKNKPFETQALRELVEAAATGYQSKTGFPLHASLVAASDVPKAVWNAPVACVITGPTEGGSECVYCNVAALEAYGLDANSYGELIGSATVLPAEMGGDVKFDSDYGKKLKLKTGDSFTITGTRWCIEKMAVVEGKLAMQKLGVGYMWEEWTLDDGYTCAPGGIRRAPEMSEAELEAAITAQGQAVRQLKEGEGLTNKDLPVVEAVAELKRLKLLLEEKQVA